MRVRGFCAGETRDSGGGVPEVYVGGCGPLTSRGPRALPPSSAPAHVCIAAVADVGRASVDAHCWPELAIRAKAPRIALESRSSRNVLGRVKEVCHFRSRAAITKGPRG